MKAGILSAAQVAACYPRIGAPPHAYYEIKNAKGGSHFPPGLPSAAYAPFVAYLLERAQTAAAQLRLYRRKHNGRAAEQWIAYERGWRHAAQVATMRQARALELELEAVLEAPALALEPGRPPFEWDDPAECATCAPPSQTGATRAPADRQLALF